MRTMISELHSALMPRCQGGAQTYEEEDACVHTALMPRCQGGAQTALLPADPAPGDGPPPSVPAATAIAAPQP